MKLPMSVGELLDYSLALPPEPQGQGSNDLRNTVKTAARACVRLLEEGLSLDQLWRYCVLQLLDDYVSTVKRAGIPVAQRMFADEPDPTGSLEIDASFAALCEWLANRDDWVPPDWVRLANRYLVDPWFPDDNKIFHAQALLESPAPFEERNIFVTLSGLSRA